MVGLKMLSKGSEIYIKLLNCGNKDVMTSLLMIVNGQRYLINCGEGIQRILTEYKLKFGKLERIFIPRLLWEYTGGLLGLSMTLRDIGKKIIQIVSPKEFDQFISAAKPFLNQEYLKYDTIDQCNNQLINLDDDLFDFKNFTYQDEYNDICINVFKFGDIRGKFLIEKAINLNIPKIYYKDLQQQKSIKLDNEIEILPDQVMETAKPGPIVVIIDILKLQDNIEIEKFNFDEFLNILIKNKPYIFHLSSTNILNSLTYLKIINKIKEYTQIQQNIFAHPTLINKNSIPIFQAQRMVHLKLRSIVPQLYPYISTNNEHNLDYYKKKVNFNKFENIYFPSIFSSLNIMNGEWKNDCNNIVVDENMDMPRKKLKLHDESFPTFVFLGTGASIPSKYRNVSSTLVRTSVESCFLLDCGESTVTQLLSHFSMNNRESCSFIDIIKSLQFIYISHLHADHHLGTIRLIKAYNKYNDNQSVTIIGPTPLKRWLQYYSNSIEKIYFKYIDCGSQIEISTYSLEPFPVLHSIPSFGITIKVIHRNMENDDYSIVYTGDTYPCSSIIKYGYGAKYLIHEATFDDSMEEEAAYKCHSTVKGALVVASLINCKCVFLTHFSQRYPKIAPSNHQTSEKNNTIQSYFKKYNIIQNINVFYKNFLNDNSFELNPLIYSTIPESSVTSNPIVVCASDHMEVNIDTLHLYDLYKEKIMSTFEEISE